MRITLADDRLKMRLGLNYRPRRQAAGEARQSGERPALWKTAPPDPVLLDWELPGRSIDALSLFTPGTIGPGLRVIALSGPPEVR